MALNPFVNVKCPCCGHILEVDVEKERVIAHRKGKHLRDDADAGEDEMDVALRQQKDSIDERDQAFLDAQKRLKNQSQRLDDLFDQARKKTRDGEDDPLPGKLWD